MIRCAAVVAVLSFSTSALAVCSGYGASYQCFDQSGNSYNVQRYGNATHMQGFNSGTGSSWSQQSYRNGNMTNTYGSDGQGRAWNETTISNPGMVQQFGSDANGTPFFRTCTSAGCF